MGADKLAENTPKFICPTKLSVQAQKFGILMKKKLDWTSVVRAEKIKVQFTIGYTNRQITALTFFAITNTITKLPGNEMAESVKSWISIKKAEFSDFKG